MAITKSAKKALKRNEKLTFRNKQFQLSMKNAIKTIKRAVVKWTTNKNPEELLQTAYSAIDKALKRNILHKNTAARRKSLVTKMVAKISS